VPSREGRHGEVDALGRTRRPPPHRVHLDHGYLHLDPDDGSLHEVDGRLFLGPPKNGKARTIHLPAFLIDLLAEVSRTTTQPIARFKVRKPESARRSPSRTLE
jgi:hypothetical protein